MIQPLQIDSYTRDLWQEYDAYALAVLAPLAYDDCYRIRFYVGLDSDAQFVEARQTALYNMHVQPGSLIYGVHMGPTYTNDPQWSIQVTDLAMGMEFWSDPISVALLGNEKGPNFPRLFSCPRPVVGDGLFQVEVTNQQDAEQFIVPIFGVLEVK